MRPSGSSTRCTPITSISCCSSIDFFGKMLMLDGATQVTSREEFIYHEMMTHVPIFAHGRVKEVLIVGGGDLRHRRGGAQAQVGRACHPGGDRRHPWWSSPRSISRNSPSRFLADGRFDLIIDDGMKYVAKTDPPLRTVIIVDSTDPHGARQGCSSAANSYAACPPLHAARAGVMVTQKRACRCFR